METYAITVYVIAEEVLRILNIHDDPQACMSQAEVITFAIITAKFFSGNYKLARYVSGKLNLFPRILSNSRLNRRIHSISWNCWYALFRFLSLLAKHAEDTCYFAVDSLPIEYCQRNRIDKRKCFSQPKYLGFAASKQRYFCGFKIHMVVTNKGRPIELHLRPGSESDVAVLWTMELDIPSQAVLYADGGYNCFDLEDLLQEEGILLLAKRGSKAKNRIRSQKEEKEISSKRQVIETAFSCITKQFPRYIKSRTENGFVIKIFCFVLSYSVSFFWQDSLT